MRSQGRVRNAGPTDSVYRPTALAVLEGSMEQCWPATAAAPVWRVTGSTLPAKQLRTRLKVGRSGLDVVHHRVRIVCLDQRSQVLIVGRHHVDQQRLQTNVPDLSGDIQQDTVGASSDLLG